MEFFKFKIIIFRPMDSTARGGLTPSPASPLHLHTYHGRNSNSRQKAISLCAPFSAYVIRSLRNAYFSVFCASGFSPRHE